MSFGLFTFSAHWFSGCDPESSAFSFPTIFSAAAVNE
jgi:hypothetical protein